MAYLDIVANNYEACEYAREEAARITQEPNRQLILSVIEFFQAILSSEFIPYTDDNNWIPMAETQNAIVYDVLHRMETMLDILQSAPPEHIFIAMKIRRGAGTIGVPESNADGGVIFWIEYAGEVLDVKIPFSLLEHLNNPTLVSDYDAYKIQ